MKKQFKLTDSKLVQARLVDSIKHEINKYIARERRKTLGEGVDFWDFDCRYGADVTTVQPIHISEINKMIDSDVINQKDGFYIEILSKPGKRSKKSKNQK